MLSEVELDLQLKGLVENRQTGRVEKQESQSGEREHGYAW